MQIQSLLRVPHKWHFLGVCQDGGAEGAFLGELYSHGPVNYLMAHLC